MATKSFVLVGREIPHPDSLIAVVGHERYFEPVSALVAESTDARYFRSAPPAMVVNVPPK